MDAKYLNFTDQYVVSGNATPFSRDGKEVPAVPKNVLYAQAAFDAPSGLGAWVETTWTGDYFANNANTLTTPGYNVWNANVHVIHAFPETSWFHFIKGFIEMDNLFDRDYIASTAVVSDATTDANKQAFFAGNGRAVYGGVTVGF
jgi:iron complex outermembrane receptor protein